MATTKATELAQFAKTLTVDDSGNTTLTGTVTAPSISNTGGGTFVDSAEVSGLIDSAFTAKSTDNLSEGSNLYYTDARADARVNLQTGANLDLSSKSTSDLSEGSNLYYTTARADSDAKAAISVTDAGGDGSLSYSAGVITYTGPSASEVRAHFSAGTGVSISSGEVSIGQSVGTSDNVTFVNGTFTGDLTVSGTTTYVNTTTLNIGDNIITLNADETGTPSQNAGIEVERGTTANVSFVWDETNDRWSVGTEDLFFDDNAKAIFGAGSDLQIYHDGSHSYIQDAGTGNLFVQASNVLWLRDASGTAYFSGTSGNEVALYHNGSEKLRTTTGGIDVTGRVTADGLTVDNGSSDARLLSTNTAGTTYIGQNTAFTDFWSTANLSMRFATNNSEKVRITSGGNVGINETNPETLLHISDGTIDDGPIILIEGSGQNAADNLLGGINFRNLDTSGDGPTITGAMRHYSANSTGSGGYTTFHTHDGSEGGEGSDAPERMRIDASGNVGIGTASPETAFPLTVYGGNGGVVYKNSTTTSALAQSSNHLYLDIARAGTAGDLIVRNGTGLTERMRIDSSGNVGIGTSSPAQKLEVNGNTNINGWIKPELIQHMYDPTGATNTPAGYASATSSAWTLSFVNNDANYPGSYGTILSMIDSNNNYGYSWQLFKGPSTENLYLRTGGSNVWSSWRKIWHEGNDGSGSGLDADLLDGQSGGYYTSRITHVDGLTSSDNLNSLGSNYGWYKWASSVPSNAPTSYGIMLYLNDTSQPQQLVQTYGGATNKVRLFGRRQTSGVWDTSWTEYWSDKNDGSGSGLDADTLDGVQGSNYLRSNTDDTFNGILTVNSGTTDYQIALTASDTWTGILFNDNNAINDYIWYNGNNGTFAIGGGGSNVAGKKLHIDGGTSIGASSDGTAVPTNGLYVQGNIVTDGTAIAETNTASKAAGSHQPNMGTYQNFVWTLTGNITLSNQSADYIGQTGFFVFIQDGTGGRTVSLGSAYETVSGGGLTLSSAAGSTDIVPYVYAASGRILLGTPQLAFA